MGPDPVRPGRWGLLLGLALCGSVAPAAAQAPAGLGAPQGVLTESFSQIRGVRELADGRLLLTDWIEERLVMIDAAFTRATRVGRTGAGPQEYRLPASLWPMAADSTLLSDVGNGRFLVIAPDGRFARTNPADEPGLGSVSGVDDQGRLYFAMPAWARGSSALPEDSLEVFRFDPRTTRRERLAVVKGSTPPTHRGPRLTPGFSMVALSPQDAWRVLPGGGLVIARSGDYRIEHITAGGVNRGPSYRYVGEPTQPADRTAFVQDFVARSPTSGRGPDGGMGHTPPMSAEQIAQMVATNEFAPTLPPFERIVLGPDGELWVQRGRHAGAAAAYDRFDPAGARLGQVQLPAGREVVALGRRYVYVANRDADDLQTLERYARPR